MATIKQYQEDPYKNYLQKTRMVESGGDNNAKAKTSSALGSYQFLEGTWKEVVDKYNLGYTLQDRTDPEKAEKVMRLFTEDNEKALKPVLGRNLTDGEKYLGHFLGISGASNMFKASKKDPNMPVSYYISPKTIEANKSVFYNKDGSVKTTQQVYDWANKKMGVKAESYREPQETPTTPLTDFDIPQIVGNFASVPDSPKEEETVKKEEKEKPSEALNKLKEEEFLKQYKSLYVQQPQTPQQQERQPTENINLQDIYSQVSQFVDTPIVAQQGTKIEESDIPDPINGIVYNPEGGRTYYDGRLDRIVLTPQSNFAPRQAVINHEKYHKYQFDSGRSNFDIANNTDNSTWAKMQKKPELMSTDDVYYNYHNRKGIENYIDVRRVKENETLKFIPDDIVFDKFVDRAQYENPYSLEGEATSYERSLYKQSGGEMPISSRGVYDYPGQDVIVPTTDGRVTMKSVDYPILGVDEFGNRKTMMPGKEYQFPGKIISEYPQLSEKEKAFLKYLKNKK